VRSISYTPRAAFDIRPDGYVGLFQRPIDERGLRAHLAKLFAAGAVDAAFAALATRTAVKVGGARRP
jgi:hypothetical protein